MYTYLLVITGAMKNLFHPAWVTEHLIFFAFGLVLVFGLQRMELPRWSLLVVPVLYLMGEGILWLTMADVIDTGGTTVFELLYHPVRYLLFFSLGEGVGLLIKKVRGFAKKNG